MSGSSDNNSESIIVVEDMVDVVVIPLAIPTNICNGGSNGSGMLVILVVENY